MLSVFREELDEAGHDSITELSRSHVHLDDDDVRPFVERLLRLVDEYMSSDDARREAGAPGYGGVIALHRLADTANRS